MRRTLRRILPLPFFGFNGINKVSMTAFFGRCRRALFGISDAETRVERRGFKVGDDRVKARIDHIGKSFVDGYHAALLDNDPLRLTEHLNAIGDNEWRGFFFEGAAMGLVISDFLCPWQPSRFQAFLTGPAQHHAYMLHVGAGWALARLPVSPARLTSRMDSLLRWLVLDGYGFHEGYFHWPDSIGRQQCPSCLQGYEKRAFDQGLGRSLWFVMGADPERIVSGLQNFPPDRLGDLWSGVGLAGAYAGGVEPEVLERLKILAGDFAAHLAQGAAFAAKARQRAGNPTEHTELACRIFCNLSAEHAAQLTDDALRKAPADNALPAYEHWRQRIRQHFI
ncbi:DUF1702 family protein [Methylotuvimicrobium sp. KM1]|uniref:DUF1702 family protein n=1 Tax=Methylotuvimicrobium sp. KM1 TaxID=3377707 RepID=UPI00384C3839